MFCITCGCQLKDNAKFCISCGSPVKAPDQPVQPEIIAPVQQTEFNAPAQQPEFAAPVQQTEFNAPVQQTEFNAPVQQPEFTAPVQQPEFAAPVQQPEFNAPVQQPEFNAPVQQPEFNAPAQQPEFNAPVQQTEFNAPAQQTEFTAPVQQTEFAYPSATANVYHTGEKAATKKGPPIAVTIIVSVVFGLLILVTSLSSALLGTIRGALDSAYLSESIENLDPLDLPIGDILLSKYLYDDIAEVLDSYDIDMSSINENTTVSEFVIMLSGDFKLTRRELNEIVKELELMDYLGDIVSSYEHYLLTNDNKEVISINIIMDMIDDNIGKVSEICNAKFEINEDLVYEELKNNESTIKMINPYNALGGAGAVSSIVLSLPVIIILIVLSVGFAAIVGLISKGFSAPCFTFGAATLLSGSALIAIPIVVNALTNSMGISFDIVENVVISILNQSMFNNFTLYGIIAAAIGILAIAGGVVIAILGKAKRKAVTA